jgi:hypothetical protein
LKQDGNSELILLHFRAFGEEKSFSPRNVILPSDTQDGKARFTHTEERFGKRILIVSTCNECGAANIVSRYDGSLEAWERNHKCEKRAMAS